MASLRSLGFVVEERSQIPSAEELTGYHAIVVRACSTPLTSIGARVRAKPHFGRRVLIALVREDMAERERREATMSGFDLVVSECCTARDIASHVLRLLRGYPEYRCLLRTPNGRRKAA
jgi:hypothetical protein